MRTTARSVSGSSPTSRAGALRPSASPTSIPAAPCTTWLLVITKPSGVKMNPDPAPPRRPFAAVTSMFTTAGPISSTAPVTAR